MTRVIMHGCNGHMGRTITAMVEEDPSIEIVAGVDPYEGVDNKYPLFPTMAACDIDADVVIDFSNARAIDVLLEQCLEKKLPIVLCTTGLSDDQLEKVQKASEQIAILRSANMSLGVNTLLDLIKKAAGVFAPAGFDMEIVERHHNQKVDAPSGTALALADALNDALDEKYEYVYDRSSRREKRPVNEIGISAVRGGNIVGDHEIIFAGTDEVISFRHTATSKAVFAKGAIEASKYLAGKPAGMYDMQDVISDR